MARKEKGGQTNRADELVYDLSLRSNFQKDVFSIRRRLGIPEAGFSNESDRLRWLTPKVALSVWKSISSLLQKHSIPPIYRMPIARFVETGSTKSCTRPSDTVAAIDRYAHRSDIPVGNMDEAYRASRQPFAKLYLFGSTKEEVHRFIDQKWDEVREIFLEQDLDTEKRSRRKMYKDRDALIVELWRKPAKELERMSESDLPYEGKEYLVQRVLKNTYGKTVSVEYIKKIAFKYAKSRRQD